MFFIIFYIGFIFGQAAVVKSSCTKRTCQAAVVESSCTKRTLSCHPPTLAVDIRGDTICLEYVRKNSSRAEAVKYCSQEGYRMFDVPSRTWEQALKFAGVLRLKGGFHPWMGIQRRTHGGSFYSADGRKQRYLMWERGQPKAGFDCVVYGYKSWQSVPCEGTVHSAACWRYKFLQVLQKRKPESEIRVVGRDNATIYRDTTFTFTCSVVRSQPTNMSIVLLDQTNTSLSLIGPTGKSLQVKHVVKSNEITGPDNLCAYTNLHTVQLAVDTRLDGRRVACFEKGAERNFCQKESRGCVIAGPFTVVDPPNKPNITLTRVSQAPAYMYEDDLLEARCAAHVDAGYRMAWGVLHDNNIRKLKHGIDGVHIGECRVGYKGNTTIKIPFRKHDDRMMLVCFSRHTEVNCSRSNLFCQLSATLHIRERPDPSTFSRTNLSINVNQRPSTLYLGQPFEARCSSPVGEKAVIMTWTILKEGKHYLIAEGDKVHCGVKSYRVKIINASGKITSVLTRSKVVRDLDGVKLVCFSREVSETFECRTGDQFCMTSQSLVAIYGPHPPILNVTSALREGQDLVANCTSNVGESSSLEWVVGHRGALRTLPHGGFTETRSSKNVSDGIVESSILHLHQIGRNMNGTVLACFSYPVSSYTDKNMECRKTDIYCRHVQLRVKGVRRHRKDSPYAGSYDFNTWLLFFPTLWILLVLLVALCLISYGYETCEKEERKSNVTMSCANRSQGSHVTAASSVDAKSAFGSASSAGSSVDAETKLVEISHVTSTHNKSVSFSTQGRPSGRMSESPFPLHR